jgi:hypothetical protein
VLWGFFMSWLDVAANTLLFYIWKEQIGPCIFPHTQHTHRNLLVEVQICFLVLPHFIGIGITLDMQFLHFAFGVGSTVAPFFIGLVMTLSSSLQLALSYWTIAAIVAACLAFCVLVPSPPPLGKKQEEDSGEKKVQHRHRFYLSIALAILLIS